MIKRSGRGGGLSRRRGDLLFWAKRTREGSNMFFGLSAIFAATGGVSLNRSGSKAVMALMAVMERWLTDGPANEEKWRRGGQHLNVLDDGAATQSQALQVCVNSSVPNSCQLIFKFRDFFFISFPLRPNFNKRIKGKQLQRNLIFFFLFTCFFLSLKLRERNWRKCCKKVGRQCGYSQMEGHLGHTSTDQIRKFTETTNKMANQLQLFQVVEFQWFADMAKGLWGREQGCGIQRQSNE